MPLSRWTYQMTYPQRLKPPTVEELEQWLPEPLVVYKASEPSRGILTVGIQVRLEAAEDWPTSAVTTHLRAHAPAGWRVHRLLTMPRTEEAANGQ
jgi:hypothetical protein